MDKPSLFARKEMILFASVMIKIVTNFQFWLSSRFKLGIIHAFCDPNHEITRMQLVQMQ